jgi:hypothetical protein
VNTAKELVRSDILTSEVVASEVFEACPKPCVTSLLAFAKGVLPIMDEEVYAQPRRVELRA